ncbi:hypothetical protein V8D89_016264 [Ganoderma adspersum]
MDHGKVTCDRCRCKHWKCTHFGRNSHGEIKGKEKNIPWAVFNGVRHSIYKVPKDYLPWVEVCCHAVESSREASAVTVIQPKGIAAVLKNSKFCPSGKGLTEYWYDPATLPKYNPRKMPKCKVVKGAWLIFRSQNDDDGDKEEEDEALELQAALDIPPYNDELMDLMNFHTERTWPEITAEDAQKREESTFNNTAPEEMAEQVDQMVQQDVVSRQAEDSEQPTANASATNAPDVLGIDSAEYDAPAIHRDNRAFVMRINGLQTMHQALLSEEMTVWTLRDHIEHTERALTNMLFGEFSRTHIYPYDVHAYCVYLAAKPNPPMPSRSEGR